jgi:hypothetical protein
MKAYVDTWMHVIQEPDSCSLPCSLGASCRRFFALACMLLFAIRPVHWAVINVNTSTLDTVDTCTSIPSLCKGTRASLCDGTARNLCVILNQPKQRYLCSNTESECLIALPSFSCMVLGYDDQ